MVAYCYCSIVFTNIILLIAFIYGIFLAKILTNKHIRWYVIYLGFILGIEISTKALIYIFKSNNTQLVYPFYIAGEFFILQQVFLSDLKLAKRWDLIVGGVAVCVFLEGMLLCYAESDVTASYGTILSHLTIVGLSAYLLVRGLKEFRKNNQFLIVYAALFLYYAVSLFLFLLMDQLTRATIVIWSINNLLSAILYGSSIYTFYKLKKSY